jgi:nucleoid-associated protein YgaU
LSGDRLQGAAWALAFLVLAASIGGCGKPVLRVADASIGDYYTPKEFKKLSKEQRAEYCAELARQDSVYKEELLGLKQELDQTQTHSLRLREEGDSLFAVGSALEARAAGPGGGPVEAEQKDPGARADQAERHVVRPGESLWSISASRGVFGEGGRWRALYEKNRPIIKNPDLIYPGQELTIPR